jgi:hypothetical protein
MRRAALSWALYVTAAGNTVAQEILCCAVCVAALHSAYCIVQYCTVLYCTVLCRTGLWRLCESFSSPGVLLVWWACFSQASVHWECRAEAVLPKLRNREPVGAPPLRRGSRLNNDGQNWLPCWILGWSKWVCLSDHPWSKWVCLADHHMVRMGLPS